MSSPELNFLTTARSQVRFDIGVRNFRFQVFFMDSRMDTCHGVSTTWWGVYLVSRSSPFARWCWFPHELATVVSFNNYAPMASGTTYHQTPFMCLSSWSRPWTNLPLMEEFFPWNSDGESSTCLFHAVDGLSSLNSILIFSYSKPRWVTAWVGLSNVVYRCGTFLLNSLKVIALLHHTSLRHNICSMIAPYHKHQHPSEFQSWLRV
jgi:hypothetical protein